AVDKKYLVPDLGRVRWDDVEDVLHRNGLGSAAVQLTRGRFDALVARRGREFGELPLIWDPSQTFNQAAAAQRQPDREEARELGLDLSEIERLLREENDTGTSARE